jgi:hypothetical protein
MATDGRGDAVLPGERWTPAPDQETEHLDHLRRLLNAPGRDTPTAPATPAPATGRGNDDDAERWRKEREAEEREEVGEEVEIPPQRDPSDSVSMTAGESAVDKFLDQGITRLDVIRDGDVGSGSRDGKPASTRSGARAADNARTM